MKILLLKLILLISMSSAVANISSPHGVNGKVCNANVYIENLDAFESLERRESIGRSAFDIITFKNFHVTDKESNADFKLDFTEKGSLRDGGLVKRGLDNIRENIGNSRAFTDSYLLAVKWKNLKTGKIINIGEVNYKALSRDNLDILRILSSVPSCSSVTPNLIEIESYMEENPLRVVYNFYVNKSSKPQVSTVISELGVVINKYEENGRFASDSYNLSPFVQALDFEPLSKREESGISTQEREESECIHFRKSIEKVFFGTTRTEDISICKDRIITNSDAFNRFFQVPLPSFQSNYQYSFKNEKFVKRVFSLLNGLTEERIIAPKILEE